LTYLFPGCYFYLFARPSDFSSISFGSFWKRKTNTRTQHINSIVSARLLFLFFKRTRPAQTRPDPTSRWEFISLTCPRSLVKINCGVHLKFSRARSGENLWHYTQIKEKQRTLIQFLGFWYLKRKKEFESISFPL
jgi:hypothetical protein